MSGGPFARAACWYADRGGLVFPLAPRRKCPAIREAHPKGDPLHGKCVGACGREGHGFHDATTNTETIVRWAREHPRANIGIRAGEAGGFDALDVDPRHGGDATLTLLEREHGPLPVTPESASGGGGRHVLFLHRPGLRFSGGRLAGLDVIADGAGLVAPPSVHPNGRTYAWVPSRRLFEIPLVPWPEWLVAPFLSKPAPKRPPAPLRLRDGVSRFGLAVLRNSCKAIEAAAEGTRHATLRARARVVYGYVGGGEIEEELARDCLEAAALAAGLDPREASRTLDWCRERGMAEPLSGTRSRR